MSISKDGEEITVISHDGETADISREIESDQKQNVRQKRLLTWMLSKNVPPVPSEDEVGYYPQNIKHFFNYMFFTWLIPLFNVGYKRTLEEGDIWKFRPEQKVEYHDELFQQTLTKNIARWRLKNPDKDQSDWPLSLLLLAFFHPFWKRSIFATLAGFWNEYSYICITIITKKLISFVEKRIVDRSTSLGPGIGFAFLNMLLNLSVALAFNHMFDLSMRIGVDAKSILVKNCFEKATKLNAKGKNDYPISKITTLIGNDLSRFEFAFAFGCIALPMFCSIITNIALLIANLGVSALPGIFLLFLTCAVQALSSIKLYSYRTKLNKFTDSRVAYVRELLSNFKTIKFYSWESPYYDQIKDTRDSEMEIVLKMKLVRSLIECASFSLPLLSTMLSFLVLYKLRGLHDVAAIFSSLSLFGILADEVSFMPIMMSTIADALNAVKRVHGLLKAEELDPTEEIKPNYNSSYSIDIKNGHFEWEKFNDDELEDETTKQLKQFQMEEAYELQSQISNTHSSIVPIESILQESFNGFHGIDLSIERGEFIIITGIIGSGKTSLLSAISGLMKMAEGSMEINDSMLFCGFPWVQNATVRENIIFGSEYVPEKYQKVISACALREDLKNFDAGDMTEVGERGVTLSGGQKARINLARAVYAERNIILLDDVLSAVDSKVGQHIMSHCFMDLLKDKTRLVATHQLSLITAADRIIFLNQDGSLDVDTTEELKSRNAEFCKLLSFNTDVKDTSKPLEELEIVQDQDNNDNEKNGAITKDEQRAVNALSWSVYKAFLFGGEGWKRFVPSSSFIISLLITVFAQRFTNVWLSFWSENKFESLLPNTYLGLYIFFNFLCVISTLSVLTTLSWLVNNASKSIVIKAIQKLLHAPMSFMDTTPLGRIINRFTKDTDVLDNEIYQDLLQLMSGLSQIIGIIVLSIVYLPWIAIALPILIVFCACVADYGQASARETKRIEAIRRSFIFNNINETLGGLSTIKAYGAENRFLAYNNEYINSNNRVQFVNISSQRWLGLFLTFCSCAYSFIVSILAATGVFHLSPASTGVLLSSILSFSELLTSLFRSLLLVENSMNSAERLHQYSSGLEQEAPYIVSEFTPPPSWPSNPSIEFQNISMKYRPGLPYVLKGVDFKVNAFEKIGVCGRTGAGKSSIMTALYRLSELDEGKIVIDGLDISKMGLRHLRQKLSIIPQDNVLFKGSIRYNLDPFGEHSDERLWDALRKSGVYVDTENGAGLERSLKFHLDLVVEDEGVNFSLGEKQLLALARALARDSNILILDEATSSVDYETDSKIQKTIKNEFNDCTILCIAHRLKTILDYDKILVLDAGEVKEFDTPLNLFLKEDGIFQEMCMKSNITRLDFN